MAAQVTVRLSNGSELTGILVEWCQDGEAIVLVGKHRYRGRRVLSTVPGQPDRIPA